MGYEGTGRSTASQARHHGSFNFHKAQIVQVLTNDGDNPAALNEDFAHIFIGDEIGVTLTVSGVYIAQSVELLWRRNQALRGD